MTDRIYPTPSQEWGYSFPAEKLCKIDEMPYTYVVGNGPFMGRALHLNDAHHDWYLCKDCDGRVMCVPVKKGEEK